MPRTELEAKVRRAQLIERIQAARAQGTPPSALLQELPNVQTDVPPEAGERYSGIGKLAIPGDYVQMGIDAAATGKPYSEFKERYATDKTYEPGDPTAEANTDNPYLQTTIKTAEDVGGDPINWLTLVARGAGAGVKAIDKLGEYGAKTLGGLGSVTTGGKWAAKSAQAGRGFSIAEQMQPGTTLAKATDVINPLRTAAKAEMAGGVEGVAKLPSRPISEGTHPEIFTDLSNATEAYANYLKEAARAKGATGANLYKGIDASRMALLRRARMVVAKGDVDAPLLAELKDSIHKLSFNPGTNNPKQISEELRFLQGSLGKVLDDGIRVSSPELYDARKVYSAAKTMNEERKGGLLSGYVQKALPYAGVIEGGRRTLKGDYEGAALAVAGGFAARSPTAWNMAHGAARVPGTLLSRGLEAAVANPNLVQLGLTGVGALAQQQQPVKTQFDPVNPALNAMSENFGPSGKVFLSVADTKPAMYATIAAYAARTGNPQIAPFFELASQVGLPGAMQMWQQQQPETWEPMSQILPRIAMDALRSSPEIQAELRKGIMFKQDVPAEEKFRLIKSINDKSFFALPEPGIQ